MACAAKDSCRHSQHHAEAAGTQAHSLLTSRAMQGRIFMTHPTKAVYSMILSDQARTNRSEGALYGPPDVEQSVSKIEVIDFHQTITVGGVQVRSKQ